MSLRPQTLNRAINLTSLASVIDDRQLVGDAIIRGITIDSRDVQAGDLFAALRGSDFDGHAYIRQAIDRGAAAILCEEMPTGVSHPAIVVTDSRRDLATISAEFYGNPSRELATIGITGTDGKSTTTSLVSWVMNQAGVQTGSIGTLGIDIGNDCHVAMGHQTTPESHLIQGFLRQMVEAGTRAVVLEATSHGLAMHRLDGIAFSIAGVTNITHEHLEFHKTIEAYRAAKGLLIQRTVAAGGSVILNADDPGAMSLASLSDPKFLRTYAMILNSADYKASSVVADHNGSRFELTHNETPHTVTLSQLGEFNVANALCTIAVCDAAGVSIDTSIAALKIAPGIPGRLQRIDEGQDFGVVVDYAHTPASLEKILNLLRGLVGDGRLIVVSGSAGERDAIKRPLQGKVMAELADVVVITSEDPRNEDPMVIIRDIAVGADESLAEIHQVEDRRDAIACAFASALPGDIVLLAGKGHESSIIWGFEHRPWDEEAVARELLQPYVTNDA